MQATIVAALEAGSYRTTAANAAGIHRNRLADEEPPAQGDGPSRQ